MASPSAHRHVVQALSGARSLYVSACAAEIMGIPELLAEAGVRDASITGIFSPLVNHRSYADAERNNRVRTFLLPRPLREDAERGLVDICSWRYSTIDRWMTQPDRFDTAIMMVSPPHADGLCSLGVQADFFPSFQRNVRRVIGFINPNMPASAGHERFPFTDFVATVDYDVPLAEMRLRDTDDAAGRVAGFVAELVPDKATIQLGTGQLPSEVLKRLVDHRGLHIHTGIVDDNILRLEETGALSTASPIVTGTAIGSQQLYDAVRDSRRFALKSVAYTHAYRNIVGRERFIAINSVLQVDLMGQVSAEAIDGRIAATPGGLPDFVRGAQDSPGGRSIITVRAAGGGNRAEGIVPIISDPGVVTIGAPDADVIVSEFGVARVRGLSLDERAQAIIAIADPQSRGRLESAWAELRARLFARSGRAAVAVAAGGARLTG